jgi:hypothetical protein
MSVRAGKAVLPILLALSAAGGGHAQSRAPRLTDEMRSLYAEMFYDRVPTRTSQELQRQAREAIAGADRDGGGLSRRDIAIARGMAEAEIRANRVRYHMGSDLDRDGALTIDEYRAGLRVSEVRSYYAQYERARAENGSPPTAVAENLIRDPQIGRRFGEMDADHDGRVTLLEVYRYDEPVVYGPAERFVDAEKYLALDSNGDGNVTMEEVDQTVAAFLAEQTIAGVGPRPPGAIKEGENGNLRLEDAVQCRLPMPSAAARIVRLGVREGSQLSNIALGGQNVPTYVVSIDIEPGSEPLYIVASNDHAAIWRISGATQRVEAFVGSSRVRDGHSMWPAVGVIGLPRARFHTVPNACFGDFAEGHVGVPPATSSASQLVMARLGRPIDIAFGAYQPRGVRLPSAQRFQAPTEVPDFFANLRNAHAAGKWREFLGHFPGGMARLDPRQIVSRAPPEPFEVYSYQAGIAQLIELGALDPSDGSSDLLIRRQIRFPAGLAGGFSETFLLPDGVPLPIGNPAHSRVMSASNRRICLIGCR